MQGRARDGFTLIELLIVVGIIGTIAAIAVPGLMRARISGNEASAIGSLRSINSAEATYASSCGQGQLRRDAGRPRQAASGGQRGVHQRGSDDGSVSEGRVHDHDDGRCGGRRRHGVQQPVVALADATSPAPRRRLRAQPGPGVSGRTRAGRSTSRPRRRPRRWRRHRSAPRRRPRRCSRGRRLTAVSRQRANDTRWAGHPRGRRDRVGAQGDLRGPPSGATEPTTGPDCVSEPPLRYATGVAASNVNAADRRRGRCARCRRARAGRTGSRRSAGRAPPSARLWQAGGRRTPRRSP